MNNWSDYFTYDNERGCLVWKSREKMASGRDAKGWNKLHAGKDVSSIWDKGCYRYVRAILNGKAFPAHRIIWELHNGKIGDKLFVDHIDGNTMNNRLDNLRLATRSENAHNSFRAKNNTSLLKGVTYHKRAKKWVARIRVNMVRISIGSYPYKCLAAVAYAKASLRYRGSFARLSSSQRPELKRLDRCSTSAK